MQIQIENPDYPDCIDEAAVTSVVLQLAQMAQRDSGCVVPWSEISIYLMNDETIAPVHMAVHGIEGPTDVITQRYDPVPGEPEGLTGEIFVNLQCAVREGTRRQKSGGRSKEPVAGRASRRGRLNGDPAEEGDLPWSVDKELALYIAHGCDHLTDAEDSSEEGFRSMRSRELAWLDELRLTPLTIKPII